MNNEQFNQEITLQDVEVFEEASRLDVDDVKKAHCDLDRTKNLSLSDNGFLHY
jgi:competence protein ComGF